MSTSNSYSGISFPPRKKAGAGFFELATDLELIKNSVYVILNTKKGSMPMNYEFGSSLHELLFEPINSITQGLITDTIKSDIERWEPRITVESVKAASLENTRYFELSFRLKATQQLITNTYSFTK